MAYLDPLTAQEIVTRTMRIIDYNVNVMDSHGVIVASGEPARVGKLHEGATQALTQGKVVEIDELTADRMRGAKPGINLPMRLDGEVVGVIGLTGKPSQVRRYGQLVQMTAEMMLSA